jgi:phospholipid transport system substrate-binding protein
MRKKRITILLLIISFIISCYPVASASLTTPTVSIKTTIDTILDTLKDKNLCLPSNKEKRRIRIRALIRDRFDFEEMAKRSLATHWSQRTPKEKEEFVSIFSELLEASYIGKIESYTNEKITYDKETIKEDNKYASVNTSIITPNVTIPIEYKVILKNNKWWVYDVVIEGVSFISTYRSQYNKIITGESYAKLIRKMRDKLNEEEKKPVAKKTAVKK